MKTLKDLKNTLFMQYSLEKFLEYYNLAEQESDKYFVKLEVLKMVESGTFDFSTLKAYINLQPEKFEPFVSLINSIQIDNKTNKSDITSYIKLSLMPKVPSKDTSLSLLEIGELDV